MATMKPRKSAKNSEARRTNVLLESIQKDIRLLAERVSGVRSELATVKDAVGELDAEMRLVKPVVQALAPVPDELKSMADVLRTHGEDLKVLRYTTGKSSQELESVKTELRLIRSDLSTFTKRLSEVEAKLAP